MWITRDKNETLTLWVNDYPKRKHGIWITLKEDDYEYWGIPIDKDLFPNLTWEDEPIEVNIIPTKELLSTQKELKDVYHKLFESQTEIIKLQNQLKQKTFFDENFGEVYYED